MGGRIAIKKIDPDHRLLLNVILPNREESMGPLFTEVQVGW